jgi:thymidylate synthase
VHHFVSHDLAEDYYIILRKVMEEGLEVAPRGKNTKEVLAFTLELTDPTRALVRGTNRKLHVGLAAAEALQLVGGFSDPGAMLKVSKHFGQFMDGGVFHAPYGPRIAAQLPEALEWLVRDPDTRKAYVSVWEPTRDLWTLDTRDHPCTTHMQFMIRNDALDLHVGMRANDAWRGFPYDVFQFTQLQQAAASCLQVPVGTYYHHATSFHLYEENWDQVEGLQSSSQPPIEGVHLEYSAGWRTWQERARQLFYGSIDIENPDLDFSNDGELLMWNALRKAGIEGAW